MSRRHDWRTPVVIRTTLIEGKAYAARDADDCAGAPRAVAFLCGNGWQVSTGSGRVVASKLTRAAATALLMRTAGARHGRGADTPGEPSSVTHLEITMCRTSVGTNTASDLLRNTPGHTGSVAPELRLPTGPAPKLERQP